MKKLIVFTLAIMLGLGTILVVPTFAEDDEVGANAAVTTSNNVQARELVGDREKISSPQQICLYKNIVRHGNDLYGVKKTDEEVGKMATTTCPVASSIIEKFNKLPEKAQAAVKQMEKIAAPWLVSQYEQIKKVGTALWGLKKESGEKKSDENERKNDDSTVKNNVSFYVKAQNVTCVINAIRTKDAALVSNNASSTVALNASIDARTACQEAALLVTVNSSSASGTVSMNQQRTAMGLCTQAFRESLAATKEASKKGHDVIWETYRNSLHVCQPVATSTPALMIEDGGGSLF